MQSTAELLESLAPILDRAAELKPFVHSTVNHSYQSVKARLNRSVSLSPSAKHEEIVAINSDLKIIIMKIHELFRNVQGDSVELPNHSADLGVAQAGSEASS